ncbi:hypothetical protein EDD86DRAFT_202898 [Gorgonomyces haynaldii]|nr:hypothetical protein EDD86DRAFT_202898 [Gorgonomyces haynaldii]
MLTVHAFYLPGVAPHDYSVGDKVPLYVNALSAEDSLIPYDYYYPDFHFCQPQGGPVAQRESLGSILFGDRLFTSPFDLTPLDSPSCVQLCNTTVPAKDTEFIYNRIAEKYSNNWVVDGLPAAELYVDPSTEETFYNPGFQLGRLVSEKTATINNHFHIHLHYHKKDKKIRIVGIIVEPKSLDKTVQDGKCVISADSPQQMLTKGKDLNIQYTYNVYWEEDKVSWGTRWDHYLHVFDPQIHWFSIINSIVIVLILTSMVSMILMRALHRDIMRYNTLGDEDGAQEEFGWKMVHADVFRPPVNRMMLSILIGSGAQILCMSFVTLIFAVLGFLSPSSRGSLGTMALVFYVLFAFVGGYVSSILYKTLQGEHWKRNVVLTAVLLPGIIFAILLILNFILIGRGSSSAVPFGTLVALMGMWFLISVPLSVFGAMLGFKHPGFENPVKTNQIPRQIPEQPFYMNTLITSLIGGILPFGAVYIELYFIMSSIWSHRIYYMFGFLFAIFLILILTCSMVSILLVYFKLCAEDYHWAWRSFLASAASGLYVFLYSCYYFSKNLQHADVSSSTIFFAWSLVISVLFGCFTGAVGYISAFFFVRTIYRAIKVD